MKLNKKTLLSELSSITHRNIQYLEQLASLSDAELAVRPAEGKWNALECVEHLNMYGRFYIPEIGKCMGAKPNSGGEDVFKSGVLGSYFANAMKPDAKPMKTMKSTDTYSQPVDRPVIDECLDQQRELLKLLEQASAVHLTNVKTSISISSLIKLRLGDTFRVVIYHNERHLQQALRAAGREI
ncbi:MAG: DinB family protein [Flavobacteriales bacterium]|nr:DinB family protein [Flavobacteriales bacterium]